MHKYRNLDGLRGLAALTVVLWHYSIGFLPTIAGRHATHHFSQASLFYNTPLHIFFAGPSSVILFFVLSGFVLSLKFFQTQERSVLLSSAARRYFRLMIPAFGSIVVTYVVLKLGFNYSQTTASITGSDWLNTLWQFPAHITEVFLQGFYSVFFSAIPPPQAYNFNLWTMRYELFGSFIVFVFLALFGKVDKRWLVYIGLCIGLFQTYYLAFVLGIVLCDIWCNYPKIKKRLSGRLSLYLLPVGLFLFAFYLPRTHTGIYTLLVPHGTYSQVWVRFGQIIGSTIIMLAVLSIAPLVRLFESKVLQFLGRISFSLYLLHLVFLGTMGCFVFNHLVWRIGYAPAFLFTFVSTLSVTFTASHFYTKYVDNFAIQFSRVIGNYLIAPFNSRKSRQAQVTKSLSISSSQD